MTLVTVENRQMVGYIMCQTVNTWFCCCFASHTYPACLWVICQELFTQFHFPSCYFKGQSVGEQTSLYKVGICLQWQSSTRNPDKVFRIESLWLWVPWEFRANQVYEEYKLRSKFYRKKEVQLFSFVSLSFSSTLMWCGEKLKPGQLFKCQKLQTITRFSPSVSELTLEILI